jgi:hypothetical protein
MKPTPMLFLTGLLLGGMLLFSQCKSEEEYDPIIPYDEAKAQEHFISVDTAAKYTWLFRNGKKALGREVKDSSYLDKKFNMPLAESFNRDAVAALLNQAGAKGVRIYLGQDEKGLIRLVLVAVDKKGDDITGHDGKIMKYTSNTVGDDAIILEAGQRCPTLCSGTGPLD